RPVRRPAGRAVGPGHGAGHGRAGGDPRHRRAGARHPGAGPADGHQQPQPAHLRGVAGDLAGTARGGAARPPAGDRERHPHAGRRGPHARGRDPRLPGRRGLHARRGAGRGAAPAVLRAMSTPACPPPRADAPLVVFDFDHTLYDGDSGSHLFAWLIRRSWWRTLAALLATPVLGPMVAFLPTRRWGISGYVWIGSLGVRSTAEFTRLIDQY